VKVGFEALILAAGRGRRLGQLGVLTPKCLLEVKGQTLLGRMINGLISNGCYAITIITGHKTQLIEEYISHSLGDCQEKIRILKNENYLMSGSFESLRIGCQEANPSPLWVFDSDIIFSKKLFSLIGRHSPVGPSAVLTVPFTGNLDAVFVKSEMGTLSGIGKTIGNSIPSPNLNEFIGVTLLTDEIVAAISELPQVSFLEYEEWINSSLDTFYFREYHQRDLLWNEIDTQADLLRARERNWDEVSSKGY